MSKCPDYLQSVAVDTTGIPIPWAVGVHPQTFLSQDDSVSPVSSPVTLSPTITALKVPKNAILMNVWTNSGVGVRASEDSAMSRYFEFTKAAGVLTLQVAKVDQIYVCSADGASVLEFFFGII